MSVVLPVYNGAVTLGRALDSLLAQDYPSDKYEIIVVNDGSTDETGQVVAASPSVRYVELPCNQGIPVAQNAGLEAAKGDVYVAFNDDFQAAPDFLSRLARGYAELDKPIGIGGHVVNLATVRPKGLMANFIQANRNGAAPEVIEVGPHFLPGPAKRLLVYFISNFSAGRNQERESREYQEVVELYGANASFPIDVLRQIDGWDPRTAAPSIGGIEDRDICLRMREQFPGRDFYVMRSARIMLDLDPHDSSVSVGSYLLRPYRRGPFNYAFHVKNRMAPPLFPIPPAILLMLLACAIAAPALLPLVIVVLPQFGYAWWVRRAITGRRPMYLLFPYLQAAEEFMVLAGLLKGYVMRRQGRLALD